MVQARDVLSRKIIVAGPASRPADLFSQTASQDATHIAVLEGNTFLGLVDLTAIVGASPARILSDLIPRQALATLKPDTSLDETVRRLGESGASALPVLDEHGEYVGAVTHESVFARLTRVRDMELSDTAEDSERCFQDLLESAPDAMIVVGSDGLIRFANSQTETLFGYRKEELIGKAVEILLPNRFREAHPQHRKQFFAAASVRPMGAKMDLLGQRKDGTEVPVEVSLSPIQSGKETLVISAVRDVSDRRLQLQTLRESEQALEQKSSQQAAAAGIGNLALGLDDIGAFLDAVVATVARALDVEFCNIFELLPDGKALRLRAGVGWRDGLVGQAIVGADDDSQAGYALSSIRPVIVEDLQKESRFSGRSLLADHHIVSGASVTISGDKQPFGVLSVHATSRRQFNSHETSFLQIVASTVAVAIQRKTAMGSLRTQEQELRRERDTLEKKVQQRTAEIVNANASLRGAIDERLAAERRLRQQSMPTWRSKFGRRLLASLLLLAVVPLVALAIYMDFTTRSRIKEQLVERVVVQADGAEASLHEFLHYLKSRTRDFASDGFIRAGAAEVQQQRASSTKATVTFAEYLRLSKCSLMSECVETFVLDLQARVLASSNAAQHGTDHSQAEYFLQGQLAPFVSDLFRDPETQEVTWVVAAPLTDVETGAPIGVLANRLDPASLSDIVTGRRSSRFGAPTQGMRTGVTGESYIVNFDRLMITESRWVEDAILRQGVDTEPVRLALEHGKEMAGFYLDYQGVPAVGASMTLRDRGWVILSEMHAEEALASAANLRRSMLLGILALVIVWGGATAYITKQTLTPIREVTRAFKVAGDGRIRGRVPVRSDDELGVLASTFNHMADAIDRSLTQLQEARAATEEASRAKSDFLANMSHELRTPLNGVIGMTELLLGTTMDTTQRRYAGLAKASGDALLALINDVLDLSKIEAGKMELECVEFDLRHTVESVALQMGPAAGQKNVELLCRINPSVRTALRGDAGRLQQVIRNLVSNAIKFTEKGEVEIRVTTDCRTDSGTTIRFCVTDTGLGIPADRINHIFQSFAQVDGSTTRKYGGTGLGLAISKQFVELMGGEIGVSSAEGKGSIFWFTAKFESDTEEESTAHPLSDDIRQVHVLAVDGNATNREILHEQLAGFGLNHETAPDGPTALRMLRDAATSKEPFGIAILNMQMPGMNGEQLARAIRSDPDVQNIPLLLLTSIGQCHDVERMTAAGFSNWLPKPVMPSQLLGAIVETMASARTVPTDHVHNATPDAGRQKVTAQSAGTRILVVEDNEIGREVAQTTLTNAGYQCDTAVDGRQAVDAFLATAYDVILMDCQMPEMDGFEATRLIREHEERDASPGKPPVRIPIIALTANAVKGDRERCLDAGMDDYVPKPLDPKRLIDTIESNLDRTRSPIRPPERPTDDTPQSSATQEMQPSTKPATANADAPFDIDALLHRWRENHDLIFRMIAKFQAGAVKDLSDIEDGVARGDAEKTASAAHSLRGAAAYLEAGRVRELTARLEEMGLRADLNGADRDLKELRDAIRRCLEYTPDGLVTSDVQDY